MSEKFEEVLAGFKPVIRDLARDEVTKAANDLAAKIAAELFKKISNSATDAFRQLFGGSGLNGLRDRVAMLPGEIAAKRKTLNILREGLRTVRQRFNDAEQQVKEAEAMLLAEIKAEVSSVTGKPAFSNDEARKAELAIRKKDDDDYLVAIERYIYERDGLVQSESDLAAAEVEVKYLEYEFTATVAQLDSINAEIGFYTAALRSADEIKF